MKELYMQYLFLYEQYISQRNIKFDSRYKFTAKELDNETSYTYFGARYYDSELSGWLSVDPMSDKYPSLSPYIYSADNPVVLVDPNGMVIKLVGTLEMSIFQSLLKSFKGINGENMQAAFGIEQSMKYENVFYSHGFTKNDFRKNYFNVTGVKLKGKILNEAYNIHRALASNELIEVMIPLGNEPSFVTNPGQMGTIIDEIPNYVNPSNFNEEILKFVYAIKNGATKEELIDIFENSNADQDGINWKYFRYKSKYYNSNEPNHKGTIVISGDKAKSERSIIDALKNSFNTLEFKCITCGDKIQ